MTIIERARKLLDTRPGAEEGQNGSAVTFGVACLLVWGFALEPEEAMGLMQEWNQKCNPPWTDRELLYKLNSARNGAHPEPRGYLLNGKMVAKGEAGWVPSAPRKKKAKFDLAALESVQDPALKMDWAAWIKWLRERSPSDPRTLTAETFLDALYEPGEMVMVFENMRSTGGYMRWIGKGTYKLAKTPGQRAEPAEMPLGSPEGMNWLMQPVDGKWRPQRGKLTMSRRTKDSVQRWPYLLLESDKAPFEMWLNALVRAQIRIVAIIASAGRSLHAVVRLDKATEDEWKAEVNNENARVVLEILGADGQAMHGLLYPRLPCTWREGKMYQKKDAEGKVIRDGKGRAQMEFSRFSDGRRNQRLLYFNPAPVKGRSIAEGLRFEHQS